MNDLQCETGCREELIKELGTVKGQTEDKMTKGQYIVYTSGIVSSVLIVVGIVSTIFFSSMSKAEDSQDEKIKKFEQVQQEVVTNQAIIKYDIQNLKEHMEDEFTESKDTQKQILDKLDLLSKEIHKNHNPN